MKHAVGISIGSSKRNKTVDAEQFRQLGIKYLVRSTPVMDRCSFGMNVMEAALITISRKGHKMNQDRLSQMLEGLNFHPQLQKSNSYQPDDRMGG